MIDGQKIWTSWAQYSDFMFVLCRTEPGSERHRGLSLLICPTDQPETITVAPITQISGDPEFAEVFLDGARAPESYVLGGRGNGWAASMTLFEFERADQGFTDHARMLVRLADIADDLRAKSASAHAVACIGGRDETNARRACGSAASSCGDSTSGSRSTAKPGRRSDSSDRS